MELVEGLVIAGRFRLNRLLGRGGMGSVWHANHLGLDIPCAVKFIEGEAAAMPEAHARFEREAKAAAQLRSPHVVQVLDHGVFEGRPYIAMELLDGEDLKKRLATRKLDVNEIGSIITQVSRALVKAHSAGIVHRDLKPDNIFLVRDDDREIAKVLDFGIAKRQDAVEGSNTRTGAMLGTPYYMSPEQAQGIKSVDHRSDLWSLAVITFQAVTGQLPFQSEALGDLLVKIIVQPIPVPSSIAPVPHGFDAWWAKATQRDPALRFQSAKDFAESLMMSIGASQMTDVMDGRMLRAQIAGMGAQTGSGPQLPFGSTPQPNMPGVPQFGMTPPSAMAHSVAADRGGYASSANIHAPPGMGTNPGNPGFPAHASTGAPLTTTASGQIAVRTGLPIGLIVGGIFAGLLAASGAVVGVLHLTSAKGAAPTASITPATSASATVSAPPATTTTTVATTAPVIPSATATLSVASATVTPPANTSTSNSGNSGSSGSRSTRASHAATATANTATAGAKGSKSEDSMDKMGF